ncbi:putative glutamine transport system permease protein [Streptococcus pneumoniae]|uniref:Glutamine transport system permease protein n=1 Tax=Streptococcus pneumoniae TaxID=1313 RepID=A0AAX2L844_STREE|nr:hypothetical protein [Streptococcus pneumoniae]CAG5843704.1 putative glutamine transport system permease protein [Streptococcus pneumoniae]CEX04865.1 putative glutamine transport system permease protein [Streptococcus pneumoniae]CIR87285.1 putative glutamine transport system permease protein [Streptococcus pneumoniae]CJH70679.1 putative glutamine transport system permease protein [Streptococcus pneumoniae]CJK44421.1 putative glutamine transport system permease protein [Streptococcus pneumon
MQILCYFTITVVAKPNNSGEVHLDVSIEDNQGGSGHNFSSVSSSSQTAKYEETGYNNNSSLYTTIDKTSDATALLKLKLNNVDNQPATEVPSSGITVKLNAKDNAGNWTSASNKKEITVNPNHSYLSQLDVTYKTPDLMSHFLPPHEVSFTFCCSSIVFPR